MTTANYDAMSLDELRQFVLTHRNNAEAFHAYIDRSKRAGRMISIDLKDADWEETLAIQIQQATSKTELP
ncbi:DUF6887 family protein [Pantanalinema rosaneae CENA516]|uniref:DUF6887 family protein n=1 Tax=Pantanalinema rosaneae TaxID=1620701 RepID=UPI003D6E54D2